MSFRIVDHDIDPVACTALVRDRASGGLVTFEGWVRDHHEGRSVERLVYQAHPVLAAKEGERVLQEALARFPIRKAACLHRTGPLGIGGMAVWVGVSSDHRGEAFDACEWIIDQVKERVPIWKQEWFADGRVEWVRCDRCAHPHAHEHDGHAHRHG